MLTKSPATYMKITKKANSRTKMYKTIRESNPKLCDADINYIVNNGACKACGEYVGEDQLDISGTFCNDCGDDAELHY